MRLLDEAGVKHVRLPRRTVAGWEDEDEWEEPGYAHGGRGGADGGGGELG